MCLPCLPRDFEEGGPRGGELLSEVFARADYAGLAQLFLQTFISMFGGGQARGLDHGKVHHIM